MTDDRQEFEAARDAGLAKRHETREARAVRRAVAEEIAAKANEIAEAYQKSAEAHRAIAIEIGSLLPKGKQHMATALAFKNNAAGAWAVMHAARDISSEETS